jgi:hypothetical protein
MAMLVGTRLLLLLAHAGASSQAVAVFPPAEDVHALTVPQPVASLTVDSGGSPVQIMAGNVSRAQITERVSSASRGSTASAVARTASGARYTLTDPSCANPGCSIAYTIVTPPDVSVTVSSDGGPVIVSGVRTASVNSGGGSVHAQQIGGPLSVTSDGGPVMASGVTGTLTVGSGGGTVTASGLTSARAAITSNNGPAQLGFTTEPDSVSVSTGGGMARVSVPGGTYAVTANSGGGTENIQVATSPTASRVLTMDSGGGPLLVTTGGSGGVPAVPSVPAPPARS